MRHPLVLKVTSKELFTVKHHLNNTGKFPENPIGEKKAPVKQKLLQRLLAGSNDNMLSVYEMLIRPHLECCVQLWNPVSEHWG